MKRAWVAFQSSMSRDGLFVRVWRFLIGVILIGAGLAIASIPILGNWKDENLGLVSIFWLISYFVVRWGFVCVVRATLSPTNRLVLRLAKRSGARIDVYDGEHAAILFVALLPVAVLAVVLTIVLRTFGIRGHESSVGA